MVKYTKATYGPTYPTKTNPFRLHPFQNNEMQPKTLVVKCIDPNRREKITAAIATDSLSNCVNINDP